MAKIDLEKLICSLGRQCYCSLFNTITFSDIQRALADQGLEYKDGAIVEIEPKKEPRFKVEKEKPTEYERGYRQATEDVCAYLTKHLYSENSNKIPLLCKSIRKTIEQNLKEK